MIPPGKKDMEAEKVCHVCGKPVNGSTGEQTYEVLGRLLKFCSPACFKEYLENPEKYADFDDEDEED
jgi:YHS domain-containing protein